MNRLSRMNFVAQREAAVAQSEAQVAQAEPKKKDDAAIDLVNQSVLFFFPSEVRQQMERAAATGEAAVIQFMGKEFTDKEILRLSNAIKGTLLSFHLNMEMKREMESMSKEQSLLESILGEEGDEDEDAAEPWRG